MSLTIPRKLNRRKHRGDYRAMCSCGFVWMRSKLWRDASGMLRCPDDRGRDPVTLNRMNAAGTLQVRPRPRMQDGGNPDRGNNGEDS